MRCFAMVFATALLVASTALADVPATLGYNGVLFKEGDCPGDFAAFCGTKPMDMTFRYFKTKDGDDQVGVDVARSAVPVNNGYFHVDLDPPGAGAAWLELAVDDGSGSKTLSPRVALSAVPYALSCGDSATVGGKGPGDFVQVGATAAVTTTMLADASVTASKLGIQCSPGQVLMWVGGTWACGAASGSGTVTSVTAGDGLTGGTITTVGTIAASYAGLAGDYGTQKTLARSDHAHDAVYVSKADFDDLKARVAACEARTTCPADMVQVGDFCVDRYEASLWSSKDGKPIDCGALQKAVDEATDPTGPYKWGYADIYTGCTGVNQYCKTAQPIAACNYCQYGNKGAGQVCPGSECDDYPVEFPDSGNWTKPLYSCAIKGVYPSRSMTWFQAQQACVNAGKHMITNGEWQAAVAGTVDPGSNDGSDGSCNTNSSGARKTGLGSAKCVSKYGVEDMIGNLWEWVDLWGQAGRTAYDVSGGKFGQAAYQTPWPKGYVPGETCGSANDRACDGTWNINGEAADDSWQQGLPFAAVRGGYWPDGPGAGAFAFGATYGPSYWHWRTARVVRGGCSLNPWPLTLGPSAFPAPTGAVGLSGPVMIAVMIDHDNCRPAVMTCHDRS